jgi:excinuclease ABC subunit C
MVDGIPATPGVYLFLGRFDEVIYVGKAVDLRRRISQHLSRNGARGEGRTAVMRDNTIGLTWIPTATELQALLLEDRLIKRYWPRYNKRQKKFLRNRYLVLTGGAFPYLKMVEREETGGGKTFGPFKDEFFVSDLLEIMYHHYGIRSCTGPLPQAGCARHALGQCAGPCLGHVSPQAYRQILERVADFLQGEGGEVLEALRKDMEESCGSLDFERAAKSRDRLIFCQGFVKRQRFILKFRETDLLVTDGSAHTHLFRKGAPADPVTPVRASRGTSLRNFEAMSGRDVGPGTDREPDWVLCDRALVVYTWLQKGGGGRSYCFL